MVLPMTTFEQHLECTEWIKDELQNMPDMLLMYREQLGHLSFDVFFAGNSAFEVEEGQALVRRMHACLTYCRGISTETLELSNRERKV
jgi:hypothetical protein